MFRAYTNMYFYTDAFQYYAPLTMKRSSSAPGSG